MINKLNAETDSSKRALKRLAEDLLVASPEVQGKDQSFLLDYLAEQALNGTDLHKAYPDTFQALMKDARLREVFADLIDSVEQERAGELPDLPAVGNIDLSFLGDAKKPNKIEQLHPKGWRILLRRTAKELKNLFPTQTMAYRSTATLAKQVWLPIIREDINLGEHTSIAFSMEIARLSGPNELGLFASIAINPSDEPLSEKQIYDLQVKWGAYRENIKIGESYRAPLPAIQTKMIEDNRNHDLEIAINIEASTKNEG